MNIKTCVVTVASLAWRGYWQFLNSCELFKIQPIVLGMGSPYCNNVDKIRYLNGFFEQYVTDYTHILFCDAYDVVFASDLSRITETFLSFKSAIVFSTERRCWPDPNRVYPECATPYRFLNSGLWMGEIKAAKEMINRILLNGVPLENLSDQQLYTEMFLSGNAPITLDYKCSLFQSLYGSVDDLEINQSGRIKNRITGESPLVFHGNGSSSLYSVLLHLGLLPPIEESFKTALKGQMAENQYRYIADLISSCAADKVLVFGGGYDTELWYHCSKGNMVCVEDNWTWMPQLLPCGLIIPLYKGKVGKWLDQMEVHPQIARPWDIVIVDGPNGYRAGQPGRQESISWASQFAQKFVVVHDYERDWERQCCDHYLGRPIDIIPFNQERNRLLGVFKRSKIE
jgi:hypothetical protein